MTNYITLADDWSDSFRDFLNQEIIVNGDDYLLGFHFRHALDPRAPLIRLRTRNRKNEDVSSAFQIFQYNERLALHTVNHVSDSLFYDKAHTGRNIALCIRATWGSATK
jgi:hypothetical protein